MIDKLLFLETMNVCQRINESQDKKNDLFYLLNEMNIHLYSILIFDLFV